MENKKHVVDVSMDQMGKIIATSIINSGMLKLQKPSEVELEVNIKYKGEDDGNGNPVLAGCIVEITEKPKKKDDTVFVDPNSILN